MSAFHPPSLQVGLIMDAMDVHNGFITEQQFRDIVEAEQLNSHNQIVHMWKHHRQPRHAWWSST